MQFWLFYLPLTIYYTVTLAYSSDMCWRNFSINVLPTPCLMMRINFFFLKKAISIKCWEWIQGVSRVSKVEDKERIQTSEADNKWIPLLFYFFSLSTNHFLILSKEGNRRLRTLAGTGFFQSISHKCEEELGVAGFCRKSEAATATQRWKNHIFLRIFSVIRVSKRDGFERSVADACFVAWFWLGSGVLRESGTLYKSALSLLWE